MIKILKYNEVDKKDIFARTAPTVDVEDIVADIIYDVRKNGDKALFKYCEKFDKDLSSWDVAHLHFGRDTFKNCKSLKKLPEWYSSEEISKN